MTLRAICDECIKPFDVNFRNKRQPGGIEVRSFKCGECGHYYFVSATNKPIRKLHERMELTRKALAKARRNGDEVEFERLVGELDELEGESKERMDELAAKVQGGGE